MYVMYVKTIVAEFWKITGDFFAELNWHTWNYQMRNESLVDP